MDKNQDVRVHLGAGRKVEAAVGGFRVLTDQPPELSGEGSAPTPFQLFLASLGACAGVFIQGFCANRGIPYEGIELTQHHDYDEEGVLQQVGLTVHVPQGFPEKYEQALVRVVEKCSVKRAIQAQPAFEVTLSKQAPPA